MLWVIQTLHQSASINPEFTFNISFIWCNTCQYYNIMLLECFDWNPLTLSSSDSSRGFSFTCFYRRVNTFPLSISFHSWLAVSHRPLARVAVQPAHHARTRRPPDSCMAFCSWLVPLFVSWWWLHLFKLDYLMWVGNLSEFDYYTSQNWIWLKQWKSVLTLILKVWHNPKLKHQWQVRSKQHI